ncbi:MAG TPA: DUF4279 domain-containing protein, partial [Stellaceae bacterium]|nr:DUF4279 domain-containing protein [Stellaceae bacterium]
LGVPPTLSYRKGEVFKRSGGHDARGRTGVWVLSSDKYEPRPDLDRHLRYLLALLSPEGADGRLGKLHDLMREQQLEADVICFWHGKRGVPRPAIPNDIRATLALLPASIETDFDTD